jgi:hypothetical protein
MSSFLQGFFPGVIFGQLKYTLDRLHRSGEYLKKEMMMRGEKFTS